MSVDALIEERADVELDVTVAMEPAPVPSQRVSRLAVASVMLSTFAWGILWFTAAAAPLVAGLAILAGFEGLRAIRRRQGQLLGRGLALAGVVAAILHLPMLVVTSGVAA
jgi:hypothetical protein